MSSHRYQTTFAHKFSTMRKKTDGSKVTGSMVMIHWAQRSIPYLLLGIILGCFLCVALCHRASTLNAIYDLEDNMQKHWHIAKDPVIRKAEKMKSLNNFDKNQKALWKQPHLLNLTNFRWVMNNVSICKPDPTAPSDTRILPVMVNTWRDHFSQREVIRKTWGSLPIYKKWDLRLIFLLGEPNPKLFNDEDTQQKLEAEQLRYGDLIMGSFLESSRNLTYKHMMGYKWILNYCDDASFVMKVEEDKFVDIIKWLDVRSKDLENFERNKKKDEDDPLPDLYCSVFRAMTPVRDETSNYYVSVEEWPQSAFDDYCSCWAYGITVDLMRKQYSVSAERSYISIDDVYLGALLNLVRTKYNWEPVVNDFFTTRDGKVEKYREICEKDGTTNLDEEKEFGVAVHVEQGKGFEQDMTCLWKKILYDSDIKL